MAKVYDLCVFGASGFTGKFVAEEVARTIPQGRKWCLAGRSKEKLEAVLGRVSKAVPGSSPDLLLADVNDAISLNNLAKQCKVLINCVGPFRFYGEQVVSACVSNKCHYVDITGEPEFIERTLVYYTDKAKENGVTVVPCCGFDSVPADLGALYTVQQMQARGLTCSSVEEYLSLANNRGRVKGHYTTYECAVLGFGSVKTLRDLRRKVPKTPVPTKGPRLSNRGTHFSKVMNRWAVPFPGSDASVVRKSQELHSKLDTKVPPVHFAAYATTAGFTGFMLICVAGLMFSMLAKFEMGRKLLLRYPRIFSFGVFSHEGPNEEDLKNTSFSMRFFGRGYSTPELAAANKKPDVLTITQVAGPEPGYVATPIIVVQCALTLLKDQLTPGVLTPAAAFHGTDLIKRLTARGVSFSTVSS